MSFYVYFHPIIKINQVNLHIILIFLFYSVNQGSSLANLSGIYSISKSEVAMNTCPCCSNQLLRHARRGGVYWFCSRCWQEMPVFSEAIPQCDRGLRPKSRPSNCAAQLSSNLYKVVALV